MHSWHYLCYPQTKKKKHPNHPPLVLGHIVAEIKRARNQCWVLFNHTCIMGIESHDKVFSGTKLTDPEKEHATFFAKRRGAIG